MGVLLQNDQPVGGISADVIETINFSDLTTTSKTLPGAINELAANPSTTESMSQAEYNALTEAEKMDGTARFVYDAISTDESELWTRVGRNTLHTDAQIISNAINEIKDTMGSGTLTTTSPTIIGGINELNSSITSLNTKVAIKEKTVTGTTNAYGAINLSLPWRTNEIISVTSSDSTKWCLPFSIGSSWYSRVCADTGTYTPSPNISVTLTVRYREYTL